MGCCMLAVTQCVHDIGQKKKSANESAIGPIAAVTCNLNSLSTVLLFYITHISPRCKEMIHGDSDRTQS